jgi:hypothetical protein
MKPLTHVEKKTAPSPWKKDNRVLKEDLPGWIERTGDDIRTGTYVSKKNLQEYKEFFADRQGLYRPITKKYPIVRIIKKPTAVNVTPLKSPRGKGGAKILKEDLPGWIRKTGNDIRTGVHVSKLALKRYKEYFAQRPGLYKPKVDVSSKVTLPAKGKLRAALRYPNGEVVTGHSHLNCLEAAEKKGLDKLLLKKGGQPLKEGFVNSQGKFLSRDEAKKVFGLGESFKLKEAGVIARPGKTGDAKGGRRVNCKGYMKNSKVLSYTKNLNLKLPTLSRNLSARM